MQRCDISIYFYWFSKGSAEEEAARVGEKVGGAEVAMLWNASQAPMARKWSSHLDKEEGCSGSPGSASSPSEPHTERIGFLLKCSAVPGVWVRVCICICIRTLCVLSVSCPCICYFYAWFIDFILWPLDWTLNEFLNSLRSGAGLINFWFPFFPLFPICTSWKWGYYVWYVRMYFRWKLKSLTFYI